MQPQRWNAIWLAKVVQNLQSAKATRERSLLPNQNTVSTPVCQTVCSSRHASAFSVGTWGPDVGGRPGAIEEHIAGKWNILHHKKRSSISSMSASLTISTLPTSPVAPCHLTKTLFTRTCGLTQSTFTTPEAGTSKSSPSRGYCNASRTS